MSENETQDISDLLESTTSEMPQVQEHVVENEERKAQEIKETYSDLVDVDSNPFNPAMHETDESGAPKLTKNGKLRKIRGKGSFKAKSKTPNMTAEAENMQDERQRKMVAGQATQLIQQVGVMIGGEDARYIKNEEYGIDEHKNIFVATDNFMEVNGMKDIPPNLALVLAVGSYGFRVMTTKPARNRSKAAYFGIKAKIGDWFGSSKKPKKEVKDDTQSNSRNDGKRKDNTSETHSGTIQV